MDRYLSEVFEEVKELSGKDYLRAVLTGYIKATAQAPEYMRLMFLEGMQKNERLEWLVNTHQRHHSHMIMNVIEQAQAQGSFKQVDIVHAKYILAAAVGAPFILGPEFELMTGESPSKDEVVARHGETCLQVLFDLT